MTRLELTALIIIAFFLAGTTTGWLSRAAYFEPGLDIDEIVPVGDSARCDPFDILSDDEKRAHCPPGTFYQIDNQIYSNRR